MTHLIANWQAIHTSHFENTNTLVTGGAGFIGSHLCHALYQLGANVTVIDDLSGGQLDNLGAIIDHINFIEGDIRNRQALSDAIAGQTFIFHMAALGSVPGSIADPALYFDVNVNGTQTLLELAKRSGVKRVIFSSSSAVYGDQLEEPKTESLPTKALSPYAAHKIAGEAMMQSMASYAAPDTVNLRYFNIFGPRQNANSAYAAVIAAFASSLLKEKAPRIFGDGTQSRDFCHVSNVVHACLLAARHQDKLKGETFNVATGQSITVNQLASAMIEYADFSITPILEPPRAGDIKHSSASIDKAKNTLGYLPIIDFETGLKETFQWYQKSS